MPTVVMALFQTQPAAVRAAPSENLSGMTNWAMTTLKYPPSQEVAIEPFTTHLLATNFPYQPQQKTDDQFSAVATAHVAAHLSSAIDEAPVDLALDCRRHQARVGPEVRWALTCEGVAVFAAAPTPSEGEVNGVVHEAFAGTANADFLEKLYPRHGPVARGRRDNGKRQKGAAGGGRQKKKKKKKKRWSIKKKKEWNQKVKLSQKKKKDGDADKDRPGRPTPSKPQRPPASPGRPTRQPI